MFFSHFCHNFHQNYHKYHHNYHCIHHYHHQIFSVIRAKRCFWRPKKEDLVARIGVTGFWWFERKRFFPVSLRLTVNILNQRPYVLAVFFSTCTLPRWNELGIWKISNSHWFSFPEVRMLNLNLLSMWLHSSCRSWEVGGQYRDVNIQNCFSRGLKLNGGGAFLASKFLVY